MLILSVHHGLYWRKGGREEVREGGGEGGRELRKEGREGGR